MAEISFLEELGQLGVSVSDRKSIAREMGIFEENLQSNIDTFKNKSSLLVANLRKRGSTDQDIINVLLDDFDNNGQLFGSLKRQMFGASVEMLQNVDNDIKLTEWKEQGYSEDETWVSVLVNTCEDCFPRHSVTRPHNEWVEMGLPGTGWSVCKARCQCQLIPNSISESKEQLLKPIKRVRGEILQKARKLKKQGKIKNTSNYVNSKLRQLNNKKNPFRKEILKAKRT